MNRYLTFIITATTTATNSHACEENDAACIVSSPSRLYTCLGHCYCSWLWTPSDSVRPMQLCNHISRLPVHHFHLFCAFIIMRPSLEGRITRYTPYVCPSVFPVPNVNSKTENHTVRKLRRKTVRVTSNWQSNFEAKRSKSTLKPNNF